MPSPTSATLSVPPTPTSRSLRGLFQSDPHLGPVVEAAKGFRRTKSMQDLFEMDDSPVHQPRKLSSGHARHSSLAARVPPSASPPTLYHSHDTPALHFTQRQRHPRPDQAYGQLALPVGGAHNNVTIYVPGEVRCVHCQTI